MRQYLRLLFACAAAGVALSAAEPPVATDSDEGPVSVPYEILRPDASWCGPRVLYFFSAYFGRERPLDEIVKLCRTDDAGLTSLADLSRAAEELGLKPSPVNCTVDELEDFDGPALISLSNREAGPVHFVGLLGMEDGKFVVLDPSSGVRTRHIRRERIAHSFTGHALLLGDAAASRSRSLGTPAMMGITACWIGVLIAYLRPEWTSRLLRRTPGTATNAGQGR